MNDLVIYVGFAQHLERVSHGEAQARLLRDAPPKRSPRVALASLLIGLGYRLAPSLERRPPAATARA